MSEPLVIIGNGMAAARLCEELSKRALGRYAVAVIGEEPQLAYNRVLLSSVLSGETASDDIALRPVRWWRDRGVTLQYGCAASAIDPDAHTVTLADGRTLGFAKLVLATGSRPVRLPLPGADLKGVLTFRDLADVNSISRAGRNHGRVVVIGGGLLGLEAAYGLAKAGASVTLLHLMDRLMERQLDAPAAAMLKRAVEAKGIEVLLNVETARFVGDDAVAGVELKDGRIIEADTVVVAVGIRPNAEIAAAAGLKVNRGIVVDDQLKTSAPNIFAIGECAEHRGTCYGLVEPAYEQARVLAGHLAGEVAEYQGSAVATNLKVAGIHVYSAGSFLGDATSEQITLHDAGLEVYRKLVIDRGRLAGAVLFGDTADGPWYLDLIRSGVSTDKFRDDLMFGRALASSAAA
jgi:nitrite reductase [NAD(P)H] large subunit